MTILFNNRNDPCYEERLNDLLQAIFFDIHFWYDLKLWDERIESYSIEENDFLISNICVFKVVLLINGKMYPALSLGAVATHPEYHNKGYSRRLIEHVMAKYEGMPMYLSANTSVTDFYPRFGFSRIRDKLPVVACEINNDTVSQKLMPSDNRVYDYLKRRAQYSALFDCMRTEAINMFHLNLEYLSDAIYELPELETMVVARQSGDCLKLYDVVSPYCVTFRDLQKFLPFRGIRRVEFGFMPDWLLAPYVMEDYEGEIFFVKNLPFHPVEFKFPALSIT